MFNIQISYVFGSWTKSWREHADLDFLVVCYHIKTFEVSKTSKVRNPASGEAG